MNAELIRRWTEETVPALCKWWPEKFTEVEHGMWRDMNTDDEYYIPHEGPTLNALADISECIGVLTWAGPFDQAGMWAGYRNYVATKELWPNEPEARLAAVIEAVAESVREKEAGNAGA